jgi:hypothetical protein
METPSKPITAETIDELNQYIQGRVADGFSPEDEIPAFATEYLSDDYNPEKLMPHAIQLTRKLIAQHREDQKSWPKSTDCDKLDAAFAELESSGIVARQDFTCCQTCGHAEIGDEFDAVEAQGTRIRGYTFYHNQDTEAAVEGRGLYLAYGAIDDGEPAAIAIGEEIAKTMRKHGLVVEWDGSTRTRILVTLDWKRRR